MPNQVVKRICQRCGFHASGVSDRAALAALVEHRAFAHREKNLDDYLAEAKAHDVSKAKTPGA